MRLHTALPSSLLLLAPPSASLPRDTPGTPQTLLSASPLSANVSPSQDEPQASANQAVLHLRHVAISPTPQMWAQGSERLSTLTLTALD